MSTNQKKHLIPVKKILDVVPISRAGLYNQIRQGNIPTVRVGRLLFVRSDDLNRLLSAEAE